MPHYIQNTVGKSTLRASRRPLPVSGADVVAWLLLLSICPGSLARVHSAEPGSSPPEMLADAGLADVYFLDVDRGWVVGDRGVILLTIDGGRRWELADSPVNCRLESVHFIDGTHGWAVGGWTHPYTHRSSGVVLRTDSGGRRWERITDPTLPKLRRVRFRDAQQGWAIGAASAMFPAGVFRTMDGGQSWHSLPANESNDWLAADDGGTGNPLLVAAGRVAKLSARAELRQHPLAVAGHRQPRSLEVAGPTSAWIVGDGGLVLTSRDQGGSWEEPAGLPRETLASVDLRDVATHGTGVWMAGAPGSCVFYSPDEGRSWQLRPTRQNTPLAALHFVDDQHGWAVGQLGAILATRDGGRSWIRQRGYQRSAVLGVFARARQIPLEFLAQLAGDEGYLSAIEIVTSEDDTEASPAGRVHEAVVGVGGSAGEVGWRFPLQSQLELPSAESIVQQWDRSTGGDSLAELEEHLVGRIRQWRPEIVVTQHPGQAGLTPLDFIVGQAVLSAIAKAADETVFPQHADELGLAPWQVKKVFAASDNQGSGGLTIESTRLATRLAKTLSDYAAPSSGLLNTEWTPPAKSTRFELMVSQMPRELAARGFFRGIATSPSESGRRDLLAPPTVDLRALTKATQKERNLQQLLRQAIQRDADTTSWLGQVDSLLSELPASAAGEALYQMGQHYLDMGHVDLAADAMTHLVMSYPEHPLAETTLLWLLRYQSSSEASWGFFKRPHQASGDPPAPAQLPLGRTRVIPVSATVPVELSPATMIQGSLPTLAAEPDVRCCLAAIERVMGSQRRALQHYRQLSANRTLQEWSRCGRGEVWLSERSGLSPKPELLCPIATQKPLLDGILDEPCWADGEILELADSGRQDAGWKAAVQVCRDDEYLYWGVACRKAPGLQYAPSDERRSRDADLSDRDRVELLLDIDRDYATYFQFTVDYRGWTGEQCLGLPQWNPEWFVAAHADETTWTVEAAIPLKEIAPHPPHRGEAWSVGIQRTVPGVGFQSWTQPASPEVRPEGFGYLRF